MIANFFGQARARIQPGMKTIQLISGELGWSAALKLLSLTQWQLITNSPFELINKTQTPSQNELKSQEQMGPIVVIFRLLQSHFHMSESEALALCRRIALDIGVSFLRASIPHFKREDYLALNTAKRTHLLDSITRKFFNNYDHARLELEGDAGFSYTVEHCHFARYARELKVEALASVFCETDAIYIHQHQPEVTILRQDTLLTTQKPCDFRFTWKPEKR